MVAGVDIEALAIDVVGGGVGVFKVAAVLILIFFVSLSLSQEKEGFRKSGK